MAQEVTTSLKLDTRRAKKDGSFPVKLCIYHKAAKQARYYSTEYSFTPDEFKRTWPKTETKHLKGVWKELKALIGKAERDLEDIEPFSFQAFEARRITPSSEFKNVFWHFEQTIGELRDLKKSIGTAKSYECSQNSLKAYQVYKKDNPHRLDLDRITPKWLKGYEQFMGESGRSKTTIAIYLRALRVVLNAAIDAKALDEHNYPFRRNTKEKGKYEITEGDRARKALRQNTLELLLKSQPMTPEQQKAKDFWVFSFLSNGMNMKDILNLRYGQIQENSFVFERIKTKRTSKKRLRITVFLNDFTREVIRRYGTHPSGQPNQLIFPILSDHNSPEQNHIKTQLFTRSINHFIKKLAIANGITGDLSMTWARHSYITTQLRKNVSPAFVKSAVGHQLSSKAIDHYWDDFEDEEKKENADSLYQYFKNSIQ